MRPNMMVREPIHERMLLRTGPQRLDAPKTVFPEGISFNRVTCFASVPEIVMILTSGSEIDAFLGAQQAL